MPAGCSTEFELRWILTYRKCVGYKEDGREGHTADGTTKYLRDARTDARLDRFVSDVLTDRTANVNVIRANVSPPCVRARVINIRLVAIGLHTRHPLASLPMTPAHCQESIR